MAGADYYLGSTATAQPGVAVRDLAALNQLRLRPGDRVFFQAGETFSGTIVLGSDDAGTPAQPIEISSFGTGRATIDAGLTSAIVIENAGGISVSRLDLVGRDKARSTGAGIDAGAYFADSRKLEHLRFSDLRISGFRHGIEIWGWHSTNTRAWPGFRDVALTNLEVFDNLSEGIRVWGSWIADDDGTQYSHADFLLRDCVVHHNLGDPASDAHTGSGIMLSGVDGAVVERCVAHNNGGLGPSTGGGPFGIWVFEAKRCTLQYNLVYNQRSSSRSDGGAFDLDGGSTDCVVQYNHSRDNDGPAVGVIQFDDASPLARNTIRYNISENDCRGHAQGVLYVGQFSRDRGIEGIEIYGNTVFVSANAHGDRPAAARIEDHARIAGVNLRNNLFVATHDGALIGGVVRQPEVARYQGNNYWGGAFDLAAFRAPGQEQVDGQAAGTRIDPQLRAAGMAAAIGSAADLLELAAYRLEPGSPLAAAGLDLAAHFGIDPGPRDFFGRPLAAGALPVGAAGAEPQPDEKPIRLVNLSVRSEAGPDQRTLILGFVIAGPAQQEVLVRGVGPGLKSVGFPDEVVSNPQLTLFSAQTPLGTNDDWRGTELLRRTFASVGAFSLADASSDAAFSRSLGTGLYTVHLTAAGGAARIGLIELYDVAKPAGARFVNVSARTRVGTGASVLIAGFALEGTGEKRLLLRGAGPSLVKLGVSPSAALADPVLTLFRGQTPIQANDNWGGTPQLKAAFSAAGAFAFDANASPDAALLVTLSAGVYTVHLAGANETTGVGLVELYELP